MIPHGVWFDLHCAHELFTDENPDFDAPCHIPFSPYPQVFLKKFGNLTLKLPPVVYNNFITLLNAEIALLFQHDDNVDEENDDIDYAHSLAIEPVSFQGYEEITHCFCDEARFHDTQIGLMTSALSGASASSQSNVCKWTQRLYTCCDKLPHLRFQDRIDAGSQPQALRNEVTFTIHLHQIKPEF